MKRYTINIGDEFPLNDERPGASGRRWHFALRALFVLAVAAIIFSHPFQAALLLGMALLVRRTGWFGEIRARWHQGAAARREAWQRGGSGCGPQWRDRRPPAPAPEREDRTKAFV